MASSPIHIPVNQIIHGDALTKLRELESESVDCCITSPPYWSLRDYKTEGQIGLEATFTEYIAKLVEIFNEVRRVLKKEGSAWVNMGDTYSNNSDFGNDGYRAGFSRQKRESRRYAAKGQIPIKSLCLIPQRFAISMVDNGWVLRNTIIWFKRNCMPSSAKDRFTVDFEYFFFFTKQSRYYFETQYEPLQSDESVGWLKRRPEPKVDSPYFYDNQPNNKPHRNHPQWPKIGGNKQASGGYGNPTYSGNQPEINGLGRIKRCIWEINPQPFSGSQFLADYVGTDGKPYKASPDCPIHAHLGSPQVARKERYDEQSTSALSRNLGTLNDHDSKQPSESYAKSLSSNGVNMSASDKQQIAPSNPESKNHHKHEGPYAHGQECDAETCDHTKHTHTPDGRKPYRTDYLSQPDSQIASEHNSGNHKSISQKEQYDISCVETAYHKPDISQADASAAYHHDISLSIQQGDSASNAKGLNPLEQSLSHTADISTQIKKIGKRNKCVCSVVTTDHFAVFPERLVETPIKACVPQYVCKKCGKAREKIIEKEYAPARGNEYDRPETHAMIGEKLYEGNHMNKRKYGRAMITAVNELGWNQCDCNAGFNAGIVLDPFIGSGTVGVVAMQNARNFCGIELNEEYIKMAARRLEPYLKQERITNFS